MHMWRRDRGRGDSRGLEAYHPIRWINCRSGSDPLKWSKEKGNGWRGSCRGHRVSQATRAPPCATTAIHARPPTSSTCCVVSTVHEHIYHTRDPSPPPSTRTATTPPPKPPRVRARYNHWQIWPPGRHAQQELGEEGGGRGGRRGEQPRPLSLLGCPSRTSALRIVVAAHRITAKRGHCATIAAGSGEEGRSGEGVATEAIWSSRPPPHAPPPASADQRRQIQPPCTALWPDPTTYAMRRGEGGSRRGRPASQALHQLSCCLRRQIQPPPAKRPPDSPDPTHPFSIGLHRKPSTRFALGRRSAARGEGEPCHHPHC
jgi:hypothetical protein